MVKANNKFILKAQRRKKVRRISMMIIILIIGGITFATK